MSEIVVGFDRSAQSGAALAWAADYATSRNLGLRAIAVLDWVDTLGGYGYTWGVVGGTNVDGLVDAYKAEIARRFQVVDPRPDWTLQFIAGGRPGKVLVDAAADHCAALLVVGTREHTGFDRIVYGSVSHYCLNHATCPVVAVCTEAALAGDGPTLAMPERATSGSMAGS